MSTRSPMDLPNWEELDVYSTTEEEEEEEEEDDDDDDEDERSNVLISRKKRELLITLRFFEDDTYFGFYVNASGTVEQLINFIRRVVQPKDDDYDVHKEPLRIRDGAMFFFQGKNLGDAESSCTLRDLGMEDQADVFIIYPGPFMHGTQTCKSSSLKSLVENATTAAERGDTVDTFLMHLQGNLENSRDKIIFVEIPISNGMDLRISVETRLTDLIGFVKEDIRGTILRICCCRYTRKACQLLGQFDVFSDDIKLDPNSTLSRYGVEQHYKLKLSRKSDGIDVLVHHGLSVHGMPSAVINIESLDTVKKVKVRVQNMTGVVPEVQYLRYQRKWLVEDSKSLEDLGVRLFFQEFFSWAPNTEALELYPNITLPSKIPASEPSSNAVVCDYSIGGLPSCPARVHDLAKQMEKFAVFVSYFAKDIIILDVDSTTTVKHVMNHLRDCGGDDASKDYLLLFQGRNLLDVCLSTTLQQHGLKDQDHLIISRKGGFHVLVSLLGEMEFDFCMDSLDSVIMLKNKIYERTNIPAEYQLLYYSCNLMGVDDRSLASYGIYNRWETDDQSDAFKYVITLTHSDVFDLSFYYRALFKELRAKLAGFYSNHSVVFEIAASIGTIHVSVDVAGHFTVDTLKTKVCDRIRKDEVPSPMAYVQEGLYMLVFERKVLEDGSATLDDCGIKDKDRIVLCPNVEFTATVVLVLAEAPNETQVHGVAVRCSDTVGQLKTRIKRAAGITSSEEIILRCEEKILVDDHRCLLEYGLVEFPRTRRYRSSYLHRGCNVIVEAVTYGVGGEKQLVTLD